MLKHWLLLKWRDSRLVLGWNEYRVRSSPKREIREHDKIMIKYDPCALDDK